MEGGEKKFGGNRRAKKVGVRLDSDDDEPIGALLKLKRPRNAKRDKAVEVRGVKTVSDDEGFGGMDDTLASLRKKLKCPKRSSGSQCPKVLEDSGDRGCTLDGGSMDVGAVSKIEGKAKGRTRNSKVDGKREMNDDGGDATAVLDVNTLNPGECSAPDEDGLLEDLLPAETQKVQAGSRRKHYLESYVKERSGARSLENKVTAATVGCLGISESAAFQRTGSASPSVVACKGVKDEDGSGMFSGSLSFKSLSEHKSKVNSRRFNNDSPCQGPILGGENSGTVKELTSLAMIRAERICATERRGKSSEFVPKARASSSLSLMFVQKGTNDEWMLYSRVLGCQEESTDPCTSHKVCNESCSASGKKEPQHLKDGLEGHCTRTESAMVHVLGPYKTSSAGIFESEEEMTLDVSLNSLSLNNGGAIETENGPHLKQDPDALQPVVRHQSTDVQNFKPCTGVAGSPDDLDIKETYNGAPKSGFTFCLEHRGHHSADHAHKSELCASAKRSSSVLSQKQLDADATEGSYVPSHASVSINEEADGASPTSVTPEENESYEEDALSVLDSGNNDGKLSAIQRAVRKARKRRLDDMAYEGDEDWEVLINERFLENDRVAYGDRSFRMREKSDSSLIGVTEAETGSSMAVSVGLKAHSAGPVERIRFKEVLKCKGGLQEYLECRNKILGLWGKDLTRILPLADCGVTDTPSKDETPRASPIREVYAFLDQSGYINFGVASNKGKTRLDNEVVCAPREENSIEKNQLSAIAQLDSPTNAEVKSSEAFFESKDGTTQVEENVISKPVKSSEFVAPTMSEFINIVGDEEILANEVQTKCATGVILTVEQVGADDSSAVQFSAMSGSRTLPAQALDSSYESQVMHSCSKSLLGRSHDLHSVSTEGKKIIVVGAGPAGLTAARHLQRQGFSVIVLEGRSRIGGRVFTDRSSLSVPVDLGASIITGVEADVATGRRPDPSSLICAQLGLELTVLNSDCPLYDIVTGEKVPADLDEALEEEYNSLLDDMVLLVAQKGEHAMKMSLEDGLDYALKSRRMHELGDIVRNSKPDGAGSQVLPTACSKEEILSPLERRVMDWHYAHLEYGCAALLKEVSLPYWNQDDVYGGFGGAHCMIKGGYSNVVESLGEGLLIHLNQIVSEISYDSKENVESEMPNRVKVLTFDGSEFFGDAILVTVPLGCLKAETIKFSPPLPQWKQSSIQRLGFGVLNKVVLQFPEVFWDDSVDYFGATSEETEQRGHCFMFWNVRKTVGSPVLIALVVGKAAVDCQTLSSSDHVSHALLVLRKLFGQDAVPEPIASVVTDWGRDPFSYGAYSYVAIGSSGEDYDILGRPVDNCIFFAGESTCKEHPDTVGGAMMSGLREAVRIINILSTGNDCTAEVEAMEAAERHSECERDEVRDITKRLEAVDLSNALYKSSLDGEQILTREGLLQDIFFSTKTTAGRLHLAKKLLNLPVDTLKSFAGTRKGLSTLNSWILDSLGKDATQLLRHCVRLLVLVSTNLQAVRLSGIGRTVKDKVCVHTSRDIRAIASQLVNVWLQVFRREKALNVRLKSSRHASKRDFFMKKPFSNVVSGKPPLRSHHGPVEGKGGLHVHETSGSSSPFNSNTKVNSKLVKVEILKDSIPESRSGTSPGRLESELEGNGFYTISQEEQAAFAAAEAACAAAHAAAEAYASKEAKRSALQLPKIPSFQKFSRREQYMQVDDYDYKKKWSGGVLGRQDCLSEIDSRNCRVRDWSADFAATCANIDSARISADNLSQLSHSNEIASQMNFREQSGESAAADSSLFTKAWIDTAGSEGIKDYHAIERWQSQAAAADFDFAHPDSHVRDEEDSYTSSIPLAYKNEGRANESSVSQVTINRGAHRNLARGADRIKQAVVDFVASLLMPVYKARKIDREGYKSIMKKCATKVMEQATDAEKAMAVSEFLDFKRKNKIRAFVDKLIERHMATKPTTMY